MIQALSKCLKKQIKVDKLDYFKNASFEKIFLFKISKITVFFFNMYSQTICSPEVNITFRAQNFFLMNCFGMFDNHLILSFMNIISITILFLIFT